MSDVVMPQMGESIAEGTIVRWIKKVGDRVDRDEPLFEISTDKVDAEIPSPSAGVLLEIRAKEGETVLVNSVVAVIGEAGAVAAAAPVPAKAIESPLQPAVPASPPPAPATAAPAAPPVTAAQVSAPVASAPSVGAAMAVPPVQPTAPSGSGLSGDQLRRIKSSPLVRRIADEHHIDISMMSGTGLGGRVTKQDILAHIEKGPATGGAAPQGAPLPAQAATHVPVFKAGDSVEVVPMSVMRRKIAEHMVFSKRTSAHVHSVFEVDYTRIATIREANKADYERQGVKLTFMSFLMKAAVDALKAVPIVNSSVDGDTIVYKKEINLGIAVALDWGLIVPVIKKADEKNMLGLSRAIQDLASRARAKQLKPEEVQGGTFTITNPGVFGAQFGMPIISQPQVAIMGVGHIEKRVAVIDDMIAIRTRGYLSLGYDHRIIDGAVADEFMSHVKRALENFEASAV
ncbi:MAG: dihydrolipoamide acetyltransferase family protein [Acidobacteria bacterium]|nr:dihydrolipoamide acetyltransferase family protein [Acidobacteriota bacterium]